MIIRLEEMSMNALPALQTIIYEGWVLRFSNGYTKRANSINPIYNSKENLEEKISYCEQLYCLRKLPVVFKILDIPEYQILDARLHQSGYEKIDVTSLMTLSLVLFMNEVNNLTILQPEFSDGWIDGFIRCNAVEEKYVQTLDGMLKNIINPKIIANLMIDEKIIACGYGAIERDYIGIFDVVVEQTLRGRGYGRTIMKSILQKAKQQGINNAYLQVVSNNIAAINLYKSLGFTEFYRYWYRRKIVLDDTISSVNT